jgi:hypothetical protein
MSASRALYFAAAVCTLALGCSRQDDRRESACDLRTESAVVATDGSALDLPDLCLVLRSRIALSDAVSLAEGDEGDAVEAKFQLDASGQLALGVTIGDTSHTHTPPRISFHEVSGDPTLPHWEPAKSAAFSDAARVRRGVRDLVVRDLSQFDLLTAIRSVEYARTVFWAVPRLEEGRAGYGLFSLLDDRTPEYRFFDGLGGTAEGVEVLEGGAFDPSVPDLPEPGESIAAHSALSEVIAFAESKSGSVTEAMFQTFGGKLRVIVRLVADVRLDAEQNAFTTASGDGAAPPSKLSFEPVAEADYDEVYRSARALTLVQASGLTLRQAIDAARAKLPSGLVYVAAPTIRALRAGYEIRMWDAQSDQRHVFFVS